MNSLGKIDSTNRTFLWPVYLIFLITLVSEWEITSLDSRVQYGIGSVARTWPYQDAFLSFTKIDIVMIFFSLYLMLMRRSNIAHIRMDPSARSFLTLAGLVIIFSLLIALFNSVSNPLSFFRPIVHLSMAFTLTRYLVTQNKAKIKIIRFVNIISSIYIIFKMILFLSGNGDFVPGIGFVSTYDSYAVYVVLLAILLNLNLVLLALHKRQNPTFFNLLMTVVGIAFSISTFIRTIWVVIAIALFLCINSSHKLLTSSAEKGERKIHLSPRFLGVVIAIAITCLLIFSPNFNSRLNSMKFWSSSASTELGGQDNSEHLLDIKTGIAAIKVSPFLGSGLGAGHAVTGYSYKSKSFGFHNSPLTVWYWTGILGFLLWFQLPFRIWSWSKIAETQDELVTCFAKSVRIWFCSIFIATSLFSAWPLTSVQFCIFFGILIGFIAPNKAVTRNEKGKAK